MSRIAARQRPDTAGPLANLGRGLLAQGSFVEAEETLARALDIEPRDLTALQNLAEVYRRQERTAEAAKAYRKVLAIDEEYALAHAGLGHMLAASGDHEQGLWHMDRALALRPDLDIGAALFVQMGHAARALGRADAAEAHFRRAAQMRPDSTEPLLALATFYDGRGLADEAGRYRRKARDLVGDHRAGLHAVAESLRKAHRTQAAVDVYREALAADPDFAPAHAGLGLALYDLADYRAAVAAFARALALDPALPVAASLRVYAGHSLRELGDHDAAAQEYEAALVIDPRSAAALDNLAMRRFSEGRYAEALGLYRTLDEVNPDSAVTRSNMGAVLHKLGRHEEALSSIEAALALDPELELAQVGRESVRAALGLALEKADAQ